MSDYIKYLREYVGTSPLLTVGSWLLVINENNEVLMQLRSDFNSWDFPGGTMEINETIEESAKRELKEETNLEAEELKLLDVFSGEDIYRKYPSGDELYVVSVLYEIRKFTGELKINDNESKKLKWFKINDLPKELSPVTKKCIDRIKDHLINISNE